MATSTIKESDGAHSTIAAWEAATDNDLVTAAEGEIGHLYKRTTGPNDPWTERVTITGATTNATYYRKLMVPVAERHDGTFDHVGAHIDPTTGVSPAGHVFTISEDYFQAEGLDIHGWDGNSAEAFRVSANYFWASKCVFNDGNGSLSDAIYIGASNKTLYVSNCIFWHIDRGAVHVAQSGNINNTAYIYYCSAYYVQSGVGDHYNIYGVDSDRDNGTSAFHVKNSVAFTWGAYANARCMNVDEADASFGYAHSCVIGDTSITDNTDISDEGGNVESAVASDEYTYVNGITSAPDLTPKSGSNLISGGESLSSDSFLVVTDDINGVSRHASAPCVGAIELAAAGGATSLPFARRAIPHLIGR